ncbi:hypothetical protein AAHC03_0716 [Spirometra sp. Aus1]
MMHENGGIKKWEENSGGPSSAFVIAEPRGLQFATPKALPVGGHATIVNGLPPSSQQDSPTRDGTLRPIRSSQDAFREIICEDESSSAFKKVNGSVTSFISTPTSDLKTGDTLPEASAQNFKDPSSANGFAHDGEDLALQQRELLSDIADADSTLKRQKC